MITLGDIRAIDDLAAREIPLDIKATSPLAKLVAPYLNADVANIDDLVAVINADPGHEELAAQLSQELSNIMVSKISYIRNTVGVLIEDVTQDVTERLSNVTAYPMPVEVVTRRVPTFLQDGTIESFIDVYKDREYSSVKYPQKMGAVTEQEIAALIDASYDGELKASLKEIIALLPFSVERLYDKRFRDIKNDTYPKGYILLPGLYVSLMLVENALTFFLVQALKDSDIVERFTIDPGELASTLAGIETDSAKQLARDLRGLKATKDSNMLFVAHDKTVGPERFVIDKDINDAISESYGSDVIVGAAIRQKNMLGKVAYDINGEGKTVLAETDIERCLDAYKRAFAIVQMKSRQAIRNHQVIETTRAFETLVNSGELKDVAGSKADIMKRLREEIRQHLDCDPEKIGDGIRRVVTNGLYPDSGAAEFMAAMDSFGDVATTPREAATLAAVELYARWAVEQFEK